MGCPIEWAHGGDHFWYSDIFVSIWVDRSGLGQSPDDFHVDPLAGYDTTKHVTVPVTLYFLACGNDKNGNGK
jgi:hypothetical protein